MNELIEKIYVAACLTAGNLDEREFCEKFAELIVRECGNIAFEHWALTHDTSSQEVILKYFGIE